MRKVSLGACLVALLVGGLFQEARAQVPQQSRSFHLTAVERDGANMVYRYRLSHTGRASDLWSDVLVDLSSPQRAQRPQVLGTRGSFLLDATTDAEISESGHPPVGIVTPQMWHASIYYSGSLVWAAARAEGAYNYGVRKGRSLEGFTLWSPALPAFRKFEVRPYRPLAVVGEEVQVDSTWHLYQGYVLAPGWMPEEVTGSYLRDQVEAGCWARAFTGCASYRALVLRILDAETALSDGAFRSATGLFEQRLLSDPGLTSQGRAVFVPTIRALQGRLPSRRTSGSSS